MWIGKRCEWYFVFILLLFSVVRFWEEKKSVFKVKWYKVISNHVNRTFTEVFQTHISGEWKEKQFFLIHLFMEKKTEADIFFETEAAISGLKACLFLPALLNVLKAPFSRILFKIWWKIHHIWGALFYYSFYLVTVLSPLVSDIRPMLSGRFCSDGSFIFEFHVNF